MTNCDFLFDRTLNDFEITFWSKFFENFPYKSFNLTWGLLIPYIENFENLTNDFNYINKLTSKDELFYFFQAKDKDFPIDILNFIENLNSNISVKEMFLTTIYLFYTKDFDLSFSPEGIYFNNTEDVEKFLNKTYNCYANQIGMISDLMAGRLQELMPSLQNINPVSLTGEFSVVTTISKTATYKSICGIEIKNNNQSYYSVEKKCPYAVYFMQKGNDIDTKNTIYISNYSSNEKTNEGIYSPLINNQINFLNLISSNFLNNQLKDNSDNNNRIKSKI